MKLKDFDFRIVPSKEYLEREIHCGKDSCSCKKITLLYDKSARFCLSSEYDNEATIEMWSGFYDKNNKKIYVGDMVRFRNAHRLCVYECATFYLVDTSIEKELQVDCGTRLQRIYETDSLSELEVIGNIHENADLLK